MDSTSRLQRTIRTYLAESGRSARDLSLAVGNNDSLVKAILNGKSKSPRAETVAKLAAAMGKPLTDLMDNSELTRSLAESAHRITEVSDPVPAMVGRVELPVYASAEGGPQGSMIISGEPIDYVKRPEPLFNVRGAFACYVVNDSMSPAYEHGDLLLVHPSKPVRGGDDCLFVKAHPDGAMDALVKRLVRPSPDKWRVRQFNPAKDFDLHRAEWRQAMRIVGKYARG